MIPVSRRALVGSAIAAALSAACATPGLAGSGRPTPARTDVPNSREAPAVLPIEQQLAGADRLPVEGTLAGTSTPAEPAAGPGPALPPLRPAGVTAESAAEHVIPLVTSQAPVLRRRLPPRRIVIPRITVDSKVVSLGTKADAAGAIVWETAAFAVGHHWGTANPGENGNMVLSGHISSRNEGDVFRRLPEVGIGDGVILLTDEQPFLYTVTETKVVEPAEVGVMAAARQPVCTLITCVPDGVYTHRLIVSGSLV